MKLSPHGEWNIKKTVECGLDRANVLLQLRYQLAIAIFALIAGIWTILVTFSDGNDFKLIIPIGWALSIILILVWRLFTHIIVIEELAWSITQLFCLNY